MKDITVLGATGSVGRNVLNVIRAFPKDFRVKALSSYSNIDLLSSQAEDFLPETVILGDKNKYSDLKNKLPKNINIITGEEELESFCLEHKSDIVFLAIAGTAALKPLFSSLKGGKRVALASKEPVVSAGSILREYINKGADIIPVDSEHSAIWECVKGKDKKEISSLYITGSGGSLKDVAEDNFKSICLKTVLEHPKWDMGPKITVDSATLMNKGLEVIEARWLFDMDPSKIKVVIHPEAIIHSMVEFIDGTVNANMFCPDMKFPILRALAHPDILRSDFERIDFLKLGKLSFEKPDTVKFPALKLAYKVLKEEGTGPAVLNAANETAVNLFLEGKIGFLDIIDKVEKVLSKHKITENPALEQILDAEKWAKEEVLASC